MPPKKSIIVDKSQILIVISVTSQGWIDEVQADIDEIVAERTAGRARDAKLAADLKAADEAAGRPHDNCEVYRDPRYGKYRHDTYSLERELADAKLGWIFNDLKRFAKKDGLSSSEKQNWWRGIRELESDGFIERDRRLIRLTDSGQDRVKELIQ